MISSRDRRPYYIKTSVRINLEGFSEALLRTPTLANVTYKVCRVRYIAKVHLAPKALPLSSLLYVSDTLIKNRRGSDAT